ncbi:hypothetical protein ACFQE1_19450, partial [Halobium palmae]
MKKRDGGAVSPSSKKLDRKGRSLGPAGLARGTTRSDYRRRTATATAPHRDRYHIRHSTATATAPHRDRYHIRH